MAAPFWQGCASGPMSTVRGVRSWNLAAVPVPLQVVPLQVVPGDQVEPADQDEPGSPEAGDVVPAAVEPR